MLEVIILGLVIGPAMIRDRISLGKFVAAGVLMGVGLILWNGGPDAPGQAGQTAILAMILMGVFWVGAGFRWWQMRNGPLAPLRKERLALIIGFGSIGLLAAIISR